MLGHLQRFFVVLVEPGGRQLPLLQHLDDLVCTHSHTGVIGGHRALTHSSASHSHSSIPLTVLHPGSIDALGHARRWGGTTSLLPRGGEVLVSKQVLAARRTAGDDAGVTPNNAVPMNNTMQTGRKAQLRIDRSSSARRSF